MLGDLVRDARVWDACAGTGAVGIEALSRGARTVHFSEQAKPALACLQANLAAGRFGDKEARVLPYAWRRAVVLLESASFELIYFDPPYASPDYAAFAAVSRSLLAPGGWLLMEHRAKADLGLDPELVRLERRLRAGDSEVSFLRAVPEAAMEL